MTEPLYSEKFRLLIDEWFDYPQIRHSGFGTKIEMVTGWLSGTAAHMTGIGRKITREEAESIVFDYFHDPEAAHELEGYAGGGGFVNLQKTR